MSSAGFTHQDLFHGTTFGPTKFVKIICESSVTACCAVHEKQKSKMAARRDILTLGTGRGVVPYTLRMRCCAGRIWEKFDHFTLVVLFIHGCFLHPRFVRQMFFPPGLSTIWLCHQFLWRLGGDGQTVWPLDLQSMKHRKWWINRLSTRGWCQF